LSKEAKISKVFYGWFVVAACFAATLTLGEAMFGFGVFFKPLEWEFGWGRALVSSSYTVFLIGHSISVLTAGRLVDRYSPRPILFVSAILAGVGISLCSQAHSINQLRAFLLIGGLGAGATWSVPTSTVQRWFYNRRRAGLALGIVVAGFGVGGLIFAPLINYLILSYGWRNAFLVIGIFFFIMITVSSIVIKQSPGETTTASDAEADARNPIGIQGWVTGKVVTTLSFAGITFTHCVVILAFQTICVHLVPHAMDVGVSPTASAVALGLLGGFSVPGRIISGFISDRLSWQKIMAASLFGMALFSLWLSFLKGTWMLYCFVFFYGICHGSRVPSYVGILSEFFGMRSLGELIGITTAIGILIAAFAPYVAGFIFDTTGSYFLAFMLVMVLLLSSSIIASVIKKPVASE
jgi:OFA family oxalate/formate antiporter-like MFS transporter